MTEKFMERGAPYLQGVCRFRDRLILLLDLERLWSAEDISAIDSTLNRTTPEQEASSSSDQGDK